jgi:hypothetical protein
MNKFMVMWLIAADGVEIRSVWDALHAKLDCTDTAVYSSGVHKDEIELCFDYKGNDETLLYEALKWGRAEQALAPMCKAINISVSHDYLFNGENE